MKELYKNNDYLMYGIISVKKASFNPQAKDIIDTPWFIIGSY